MTSQGTICRTFSLDGLAAVAALLATTKCHLYKNQLIPSSTSLVADFTECDYTGYAAPTITAWASQGFDDDGVPYVLSGVIAIPATGSAVQNNVVGFWIDHGVGPTVPDLAGAFSEVVPIANEDDAVVCLIKLRGDGMVVIQLIDEMG